MVNVDLAKEVGLLIGGTDTDPLQIGTPEWDKKKYCVFSDAASISNYNGFVKQIKKSSSSMFEKSKPRGKYNKESIFKIFDVSW